MDKTKNPSSASLIVKSGLKMSIATFISRILGLVREQSMAMVFGASSITDAFLIAYRIPNLLRDLLAEGAFSAAFVPVFTEAKNKSEKEANVLLWSVALLLGLITALIGLIIFLWAEPLVALFAPEFAKDPQKLATTVTLTRWMAPYLFCVSIAALFTGVLNVLKVFFIPSLAPAAFNIIMITSCFGLTPILVHFRYEGISSLAIAVFFGGIVQMAIQYPLLKRRQFIPLIPSPLFSPMARRVVKRLGPGLIGFAATQLNLLITTVLASSIVGAVSWLNYAFRLLQFPVGIFGVAIANAHLVHFSEAVKKHDFPKAQEFLKVSYLFSLFLLLPATALLFTLSDDIIHIIFERGRFTELDTMRTSLLLSCYAVGLPFYGLYKILVPTFYAMDKQHIPIALTIFSLTINIIFCLIFTPLYGVQILAIGTSLTMGLNALGMMIIITNFLKLPASFFINIRVIKFILASLVSAFFASFASSQLFIFSHSLIRNLLIFAGVSGTAGCIYLAILWGLGEGESVRKWVKRR